MAAIRLQHDGFDPRAQEQYGGRGEARRSLHRQHQSAPLTHAEEALSSGSPRSHYSAYVCVCVCVCICLSECLCVFFGSTKTSWAIWNFKSAGKKSCIFKIWWQLWRLFWSIKQRKTKFRGHPQIQVNGICKRNRRSVVCVMYCKWNGVKMGRD